MNHHQLLVHTIVLAQKAGLHWHYCSDSRKCQGQSGFPDLFVIGELGGAFIELKTGDDDTTAEQDGWRYMFYRAGLRYQLFRQSELTDGTIRRFFAELA